MSSKRRSMEGMMPEEDWAQNAYQALEYLMSRPNADLFKIPVDYESLGLHDYPTIIKEPMDLGTIKSRLLAGNLKTAKSFEALVHKTFNNCVLYNGAWSDFGISARTLQFIFRQSFKVSGNKICSFQAPSLLAQQFTKKKEYSGWSEAAVDVITYIKGHVDGSLFCKSLNNDKDLPRVKKVPKQFMDWQLLLKNLKHGLYGTPDECREAASLVWDAVFALFDTKSAVFESAHRSKISFTKAWKMCGLANNDAFAGPQEAPKGVENVQWGTKGDKPLVENVSEALADELNNFLGSLSAAVKESIKQYFNEVIRSLRKNNCEGSVRAVLANLEELAFTAHPHHTKTVVEHKRKALVEWASRIQEIVDSLPRPQIVKSKALSTPSKVGLKSPSDPKSSGKKPVKVEGGERQQDSNHKSRNGRKGKISKQEMHDRFTQNIMDGIKQSAYYSSVLEDNKKWKILFRILSTITDSSKWYGVLALGFTSLRSAAQSSNEKKGLTSLFQNNCKKVLSSSGFEWAHNMEEELHSGSLPSISWQMLIKFAKSDQTDIHKFIQGFIESEAETSRQTAAEVPSVAKTAAAKFKSVTVERAAKEGESGKLVLPKLPPIPGKLSGRSRERVKTMIEELSRNRKANAFLEPVDAKKLELDDYDKIVCFPMDLGSVLTNIKTNKYKNFCEVASDVELVFFNAVAYNPSSNQVHKDAQSLRSHWRHQIVANAAKNVFECAPDMFLDYCKAFCALMEAQPRGIVKVTEQIAVEEKPTDGIRSPSRSKSSSNKRSRNDLSAHDSEMGEADDADDSDMLVMRQQWSGLGADFPSVADSRFSLRVSGNSKLAASLGSQLNILREVDSCKHFASPIIDSDVIANPLGLQYVWDKFFSDQRESSYAHVSEVIKDVITVWNNALVARKKVEAAADVRKYWYNTLLPRVIVSAGLSSYDFEKLLKDCSLVSDSWQLISIDRPCVYIGGRIFFKNNAIPTDWKESAKSAVIQLLGRQDANVFAKPVDPAEIKDYHDIIKSPMDLSTLVQKLDSGKYKTFKNFLDDSRLIWDNAHTYNQYTSAVSRSATFCQEFFEKLLFETVVPKEIRKTMLSNFQPISNIIEDRKYTAIPSAVQTQLLQKSRKKQKVSNLLTADQEQDRMDIDSVQGVSGLPTSKQQDSMSRPPVSKQLLTNTTSAVAVEDLWLSEDDIAAQQEAVDLGLKGWRIKAYRMVKMIENMTEAAPFVDEPNINKYPGFKQVVADLPTDNCTIAYNKKSLISGFSNANVWEKHLRYIFERVREVFDQNRNEELYILSDKVMTALNSKVEMFSQEWKMSTRAFINPALTKDFAMRQKGINDTPTASSTAMLAVPATMSRPAQDKAGDQKTPVAMVAPNTQTATVVQGEPTSAVSASVIHKGAATPNPEVSAKDISTGSKPSFVLSSPASDTREPAVAGNSQQNVVTTSAKSVSKTKKSAKASPYTESSVRPQMQFDFAAQQVVNGIEPHLVGANLGSHARPHNIQQFPEHPDLQNLSKSLGSKDLLNISRSGIPAKVVSKGDEEIWKWGGNFRLRQRYTVDLRGIKFKGHEASMQVVFNRVVSLPQMRPFLAPPSVQEYPNYYHVVKVPINIEDIRQRLVNNMYDYISQFHREMSLVFSNAILFFGEETELGKMALEGRRMWYNAFNLWLDGAQAAIDEGARYAAENKDPRFTKRANYDFAEHGPMPVHLTGAAMAAAAGAGIGMSAKGFSRPKDAENDDDCKICGQTGELLCCDGPCLHSFHLKCLGMTKEPDGDEWYCQACAKKFAFEAMGARKEIGFLKAQLSKAKSANQNAMQTGSGALGASGGTINNQNQWEMLQGLLSNKSLCEKIAPIVLRNTSKAGNVSQIPTEARASAVGQARYITDNWTQNSLSKDPVAGWIAGKCAENAGVIFDNDGDIIYPSHRKAQQPNETVQRKMSTMWGMCVKTPAAKFDPEIQKLKPVALSGAQTIEPMEIDGETKPGAAAEPAQPSSPVENGAANSTACIPQIEDSDCGKISKITTSAADDAGGGVEESLVLCSTAESSVDACAKVDEAKASQVSSRDDEKCDQGTKTGSTVAVASNAVGASITQGTGETTEKNGGKLSSTTEAGIEISAAEVCAKSGTTSPDKKNVSALSAVDSQALSTGVSARDSTTQERLVDKVPSMRDQIQSDGMTSIGSEKTEAGHQIETQANSQAAEQSPNHITAIGKHSRTVQIEGVELSESRASLGVTDQMETDSTADVLRSL